MPKLLFSMILGARSTKHHGKKSRFPKPVRLILSRKIIIPLVLLLIGGCVVFLYFFILKDIPKASTIGSMSYPQSSKIFDRHRKLLYTVYSSRNQTFVPLKEIPKQLQQATIAIEDKDFYRHGAIDLRGIARAFISTVFKGQVQGGSTITQQLVKNSLLSPERTITRKIKEVILASIVETIYSKDQILEMYLNQVAYGGTAWGVQAASQTYFNKHVKDLTLAESAFVAGLPEAPSLYSPFGSHPEVGLKRQREILRKMREQKYITSAQALNSSSEPLSFSKFRDKILAPHFVLYVKDLLIEKYGQATVEQGGLKVTTSLDLDIQNFAQDAVATEVAKLEKNSVSNGAAVITNPKTGEILAMVGSRNYFDIEHDGNVNVALANRQPGSSIKPINYAAGLANKYTAATPFIDQKICFLNPTGPEYCPVNYDRKFHGVVQMRYALANSYNIPAVKMLKLNGLESMIATASAMGISSFTDPDRYGLSLTLGGGEVTMLEMAEAFGVFANSGYRIHLHPILKVVNNTGKVLEEYKPPTSPIFGKKVVPEGIAFIISDILSDDGARAAAFGENSLLRIKKYPVSVKTGTTNDFRDNWTIGYSPSFVVVSWVGNNDNTPMLGLVSGVSGAAPIWNKLMAHVLKGTTPFKLVKPNSVIGKSICATSGLIPPPEGTENRCPERFEYFIAGTEPKEIDNPKRKVFVDKETQDLAKEGQTDNVEEKEHLIVTDPLGDQYCLTCPHPELSPTPTP